MDVIIVDANNQIDYYKLTTAKKMSEFIRDEESTSMSTRVKYITEIAVISSFVVSKCFNCNLFLVLRLARTI